MGDIFPLRDIAKFGSLPDPESFVLPPQAWSFTKNARFRSGRVTRSPVFRDVIAVSASPRFVGSFVQPSGTDLVFVGYLNGEVWNYPNAALVNYSPPATQATGWILFNVNPTASSTITLGGTVVTFVSSGATGNQVNIGASLSATLSALNTFANASADVNIVKCSYAVSGNYFNITYKTTGTAGNSFTIATTVNSSFLSSGYLTTSGTLANGYAAYVDNNSEGGWTETHLAGLYYVNRPDREPWYLGSGASNFLPLTNWPMGQTCTVLRAYNNVLCAFNITAGGINYPTQIQTSTAPTSGTVPFSWDATNPNQITTSNILADMEGPIVDANPLRNVMIIYGQNEVWTMVADGSQQVYNYQPLFTNKGAMSVNCSVEVQGKHYVFGQDDLWVHDGVSWESISNERVREFVFSSLNYNLTNRCFVLHDAIRKEVLFCYVSGDAWNVYPLATDGCNRAAVYNYGNNTWTFEDLPLVYYGNRGTVGSSQTWSSTTLTWNTAGGTWQSAAGSSVRVPLFVGDSNSTYSLSSELYCYDWYGPGSLMTFPVDVHATQAMFLYRDGLDLDDIGIDLKGYKIINSIYPQARFASGEPATVPLTITISAADYFNQNATAYPSQTYDGASFYKCDFGAAGRYLTVQVNYPDYNYISLAGFDFDIDVLGER